MYPDTDSAPIPLKDEDIENLGANIPEDIIDRYQKLKSWGAPEDTYTYIFSKNLFPLIQSIVNELDVDPVYCATFFGHKLKHIEGQIKPTTAFSYKTMYALFRFLNQKGLKHQLAERMLPFIYQYPKMEFESVLNNMKFKSIAKADILARIPFLKEKFMESAHPQKHHQAKNWVMGQLRKIALGNISLTELHAYIENHK